VKLGDLMSILGVEGADEREVLGVTCDSRQVSNGSVFVALGGTKTQGSLFVGDAVKRGALAVVCGQEDHAAVNAAVVGQGREVRVICSDAPRRAYARLVREFTGDPSLKLEVIGVTGTNGKTTTAWVIKHLCDSVLKRCGLVGTIGYDTGTGILPSDRTTPDALSALGLLAEMRDHGCRAAAMEVSSHAIHQDRVEGIKFAVGVFTNLTQDHLDYHGNMAAYFDAKASWFLDETRFSRPRVSVVNVGDAYGQKLAEMLRASGRKVVTYGGSYDSDYYAGIPQLRVNGTQFELSAEKKKFLVRTPFLGQFNVENVVAAIAAVRAVGVGIRESLEALQTVPPVPGRMEQVGAQAGFRVIVDYAHTPDALRKALMTLRALQPKRIITVFGCGGNRDALKRPQMGAVAEEYSDLVAVTSDNPRDEDPAEIAKQVVAGMRGGSDRILVEIDRRKAIEMALRNARRDDIVLIAGKGHESTQEVAGRLSEFSDGAVVRTLLADLAGDLRRGPRGEGVSR
jgi:UDP-N-acetylmuramoyl-L-alanyl-D-glutamate--2,6-diaminopimelate ligase